MREITRDQQTAELQFKRFFIEKHWKTFWIIGVVEQKFSKIDEGKRKREREGGRKLLTGKHVFLCFANRPWERIGVLEMWNTWKSIYLKKQMILEKHKWGSQVNRTFFSWKFIFHACALSSRIFAECKSPIWFKSFALDIAFSFLRIFTSLHCRRQCKTLNPSSTFQWQNQKQQSIFFR